MSNNSGRHSHYLPACQQPCQVDRSVGEIVPIADGMVASKLQKTTEELVRARLVHYYYLS